WDRWFMPRSVAEQIESISDAAIEEAITSGSAGCRYSVIVRTAGYGQSRWCGIEKSILERVTRTFLIDAHSREPKDIGALASEIAKAIRLDSVNSRKKGLDAAVLFVQATRFLCGGHIADQIERLLLPRGPTTPPHDGTIRFSCVVDRCELEQPL